MHGLYLLCRAGEIAVKQDACILASLLPRTSAVFQQVTEITVINQILITVLTPIIEKSMVKLKTLV